MFNRITNISLVALSALTITLSPINADAGERRHGGVKHWKHSGHAHGGKHHLKRRWHRRGHGRYRHNKRRWRHHRHYRDNVASYSVPANFDLSGDKTIFGGLIGAVLGATIGSKVGKGSGNTAAIVGGNIGRGMDQRDQAATARVLETSPTGNMVTWRNASTGSSYEVTPVRTYQAPDKRVCRDFSSWAVIDGYEEQLHGTACRMPDGSWKRVN